MKIPRKWRHEEVGSGFVVQYLSECQFRGEDMWVTIGHWDAANKCVVFPRIWAEAMARALRELEEDAP